MRNGFVTNVSSLLRGAGACVVWAGDYADNEPDTGTNLSHACRDGPWLPIEDGVRMSAFPFLLNHDKRLFVEIPWRLAGPASRPLHPLPVLTAEGNGRGNGDLHADHSWSPFVGTWARDLVSVATEKPEDDEAPWSELVLPPA